MEVYFITPFPDTINLLLKNNIAFQGVKKISLILMSLTFVISLKIHIRKLMMSLMVVVKEWL